MHLHHDLDIDVDEICTSLQPATAAMSSNRGMLMARSGATRDFDTTGRQVRVPSL